VNRTKIKFSNPSLSCLLLTVLALAMMTYPFLDLAKVFAQDGVLDTLTVENIPVGISYNSDNGNMYMGQT